MNKERKTVNNRTKRLFDLFGAGVALILLSPVIIGTAIAVRIFLGGPVLFRQKRPGLNGAPFLMIKFRSMSDETDASGVLLPNHLRLTRFGKILRATSLDELPELWNVVMGHMSLVGPRPLRMEYLPLYNNYQSRRHEVRPGITGWAQVNGRNSISWEEKFHLDVWYVDNVGLLLDAKIIFMTIVRVLLRSGVNADSEITMAPFTGSGEKS